LDLTHPYHIYQACLIPAPSRLFPKQNTWYENTTPQPCGLHIQANHVIIKELEIPYQSVSRRYHRTLTSIQSTRVGWWFNS
jgi:hypothetical protein